MKLDPLKLILLFALTLPIASALAGGGSTHSIPPSQLKLVYDEIGAVTLNAQCSSDTDCEVLPLGQRACGGPASYHAYSKKLSSEDITKLEQLAQRSEELARKMNEKNQVMSACEVLRVPSASCVKDVCTIIQ